MTGVSTQDGWTCSYCGQFVPVNTYHNCPNLQTITGSYTDWSLLEERKANALERIADALEKLVEKQIMEPLLIPLLLAITIALLVHDRLDPGYERICEGVDREEEREEVDGQPDLPRT